MFATKFVVIDGAVFYRHVWRMALRWAQCCARGAPQCERTALITIRFGRSLIVAKIQAQPEHRSPSMGCRASSTSAWPRTVVWQTQGLRSGNDKPRKRIYDSIRDG